MSITERIANLIDAKLDARNFGECSPDGKGNTFGDIVQTRQFELDIAIEAFVSNKIAEALRDSI